MGKLVHLALAFILGAATGAVVVLSRVKSSPGVFETRTKDPQWVVKEAAPEPVIVSEVPRAPAAEPHTLPPLPTPIKPKKVVMPKIAKKKKNQVCSMEVRATVSGARIMIDGRYSGKLTPSTVTVPCGKMIEVTLFSEKFEEKPWTGKIAKKDKLVFFPMSKVPTAILTVTVNREVEASLDGIFLGSLKADEPWQMELPAGRLLKVHFENRKDGVRFDREFTLQKNTESRVSLNIERVIAREGHRSNWR